MTVSECPLISLTVYRFVNATVHTFRFIRQVSLRRSTRVLTVSLTFYRSVSFRNAQCVFRRWCGSNGLPRAELESGSWNFTLPPRFVNEGYVTCKRDIVAGES